MILTGERMPGTEDGQPRTSLPRCRGQHYGGDQRRRRQDTAPRRAGAPLFPAEAIGLVVILAAPHALPRGNSRSASVPRPGPVACPKARP